MSLQALTKSPPRNSMSLAPRTLTVGEAVHLDVTARDRYNNPCKNNYLAEM